MSYFGPGEGVSQANDMSLTSTRSRVHDDEQKPKRSSFWKKGWTRVFVLGYGSLGAIYGDIGTSPLYVLTTIFEDDPLPSKEDVTGAISCIFWAFTIIVIIKYALIVLYFGPNNGEGGQVAIYCKISRILKTGPMGVRLPGEKEEDDLLLLTRSETRDSIQTRSSSFFQHNLEIFENPTFKRIFQQITLLLCFLGGALVISDGLLTPTTSVLSAIEGISIVDPSFTNKVMPVSVGILIGLFAIQPMGSTVTSVLFSPIILIWFITIFVIGAINISHHPKIFMALNPKEAIDLLRRRRGIDVLGAVMLSMTGCEAMFADVGHFSPLAVQLTLSLVVYPSLMLNYLGQGAYLYNHPEAVSNVFYLSVPGGMGKGFYWYTFVLATLSTIIASQALILGVFSILKQMIQIDCFPHFDIIYKSEKHPGRIFLPAINFLLMISVVLTCVGFKRSANVTAAYGLGVSIDFFLTTIFMSLCLFIFYKAHWIVVLFFLLVFGSLEMTLVVANAKKVPHGAWFTIMVGAIMFTFFATWRYCRTLKIKQEYKGRVRLKEILSQSDVQHDSDGVAVFKLGDRRTSFTEVGADHSGCALTVRNKCVGAPIPLYRYKGAAIMYTNMAAFQNSASTVPKLFKDLCNNFPQFPQIFIFLCVRTASVPHVPLEEKVLVQPIMDYPGFYRCIVRAGFMDSSQVKESILNEVWHMIRQVDPQQFEEAIKADGTVNAIQIFGREVLRGRKTEFDDSKLHKWNLYTMKSFFVAVSDSMRSMMIEYFFQPLNDLQTVSTNIMPRKQRENAIFIGEEVEI